MDTNYNYKRKILLFNLKNNFQMNHNFEMIFSIIIFVEVYLKWNNYKKKLFLLNYNYFYNKYNINIKRNIFKICKMDC